MRRRRALIDELHRDYSGSAADETGFDCRPPDGAMSACDSYIGGFLPSG